MRKAFFLLILLSLIPSGIFGQEKKDKKNSKEEIEKPDIRYRKKKEDSVADAKLKKKKNFYFGEKTRKAFTRKNTGNALTFELFNVLRQPKQADKYVRRIYYHDKRERKVVSVKGRGQVINRLLHGPYQKTVDDVVVEEGMYYYGMKHGTWMYQKTDSILYEKVHYNKGWLQDSEITYYDEATKTRIKEVMPYRYGKREGEYFLFFQSGHVAVRGFYVFNRKVGIWEEYHNLPGINRIKKQIQYPPKFHFKHFKPYIRKEWNRNAKPTYTSTQIK